MLHALSHARYPRRALGVALVLTVVTLAAWSATGARGYTSLLTIETVATTLADDDPLAGTGFYDADEVQQIRETTRFRLGLLPTPRGLFDPHLLSVLTILAFAWTPFGALTVRALWRAHFRKGSGEGPSPLSVPEPDDGGRSS